MISQTSQEHTKAIELAKRLLDEPNCDPDDDLRVLSRQLLRRHEELDYMKRKFGEHPSDGKGLERISKRLKDEAPLSSNLVTRLKAFPGGVGAEALCREAADEIERLQMRLKRHEPTSLYNGRDIDSWKSEAERLRAAAQALSDRMPKGENLRHFHAGTQVIALRAALSGDSPSAPETKSNVGWCGDTSGNPSGPSDPPDVEPDWDAIVKDAERYHYLRERSMFDRLAVRQRVGESNKILSGAALDREIDECIGSPSAQETEPPLCNCGEFCNQSIGSPFTGTCRRTANGLPVKATTQPDWQCFTCNVLSPHERSNCINCGASRDTGLK